MWEVWSMWEGVLGRPNLYVYVRVPVCVCVYLCVFVYGVPMCVCVCVQRQATCMISRERKKGKTTLSFTSPEKDFLFLYEVFTSPGKEKRSTIHYFPPSLSISLSLTHTLSLSHTHTHSLSLYMYIHIHYTSEKEAGRPQAGIADLRFIFNFILK